MNHLLSRLALLTAFLLWISPQALAQLVPNVNVLWELAAWDGVDPDGNPQTQTGSGEDWFYSITESKTATGVADGYVAAGYSTYPGVTSTSCVECIGDYGCGFATIAKIGPGGEVEWYRDAGLEGTFWRVENTSGGGFLAVGFTRDRDLVNYNPPDPASAGPRHRA